MRHRSATIALLITVAALAHAERSPRSVLPADRVQLGNGLSVVLAPDPAASSVVVHVRYGRGAASEASNQSGFTHLVERLMFAGSVHVKPGEYDARIEAAGGFTGSSTGADHLSVYEHVPPGALELALFLEAERMAGLYDALSDPGIANARDAIAAQYRSAYVDQPYALVPREVQRGLWPEGHPYRNDVLGDGTTLASATRDAVQAFVKDRIRPNNATLVIAGRFDAAQAQTMVKRYFAWIPGGKRAVETPAAIEPLARAVEIKIESPVASSIVAFRLPAPDHPDFVVLEMFAHWLRAPVVRHAHGGELHFSLPPTSTAARRIETIAAIVQRISKPAMDTTIRRSFETSRLVALEGMLFRADALARGDDLLPAPPITAARMQEALARWLAPDAAVVVIGATP